MSNTTKYSISIGVEVNDKTISEAKKYLKDKYRNKYDDPNPHVNFLIMAMPEGNNEKVDKILQNYFSKIGDISFELGGLHFEEKEAFFSLPILNDQVMKIHKDLIELLNPIRNGFIRERDKERIDSKKTDKVGEEYIYKYGYLRVLDRFTPHITIGNLVENYTNLDIPIIKSELDKRLGHLYQNKIIFNKVYAVHMQDAEIQSDYKVLWEKFYYLK